MKKVLVFICVVFMAILSACDVQPPRNKTNTEPTGLEKYKIAYKQASNSALIIDTIFMGLRFGMSSQEVDSYLRYKIDGKNMIINELGEYQYTLMLSGNEFLTASLYTEFFQDKLYKFSLKFNNYHIGSTLINLDVKHIIHKAKMLFTTKYIFGKKDFNDYYYNIDGLGVFYCYINKNLLVKFEPIGTMSYINIPIEAQKEAEKKRKIQQNRINTISDL